VLKFSISRCKFAASALPFTRTMPIPWGNGYRGRIRVPDTSDRAMTVKQLRSFQVFVQSLCKMRLLKHTEAFSDDARKLIGKPIDWFEINLYNITDEVIKKVIPFVDPPVLKGDSHEDRSSETKKWFSWVEFVAIKPQAAKILISHWWGGRFRDFMAIIEHLVQDKGISINTGLWICTFANCQWGEDFGERIMDCPFIRAINICSSTVYFVDRYAGSLRRTWCGLEIQHTEKAEKELELYTPSGLVGGPTGRASSGPLIEAVKEWDFRDSEASDESYRRQIMNYIADECELKGLEVDSQGKALLQNGRPVLAEGLTEEDNVLTRPGGKKELLYESELFRRHGKAFDKLNMTVRTLVMSSVGKAKRSHGCDVFDVSRRGITLGQWRSFARKIENTYAQWRPHAYDTADEGPVPHAWDEQTVYSVTKYFVVPAKNDKSYMETISDGPQTPDFWVNHSYFSSFRVLITSIEWFAEANKLSDSNVLGIGFLMQSERDPKEGISGFLGADFVSGVLSECEGMLVCLDNNRDSMTRTWRLLELEVSARLGLKVYLGCSTGVIACSQALACGGWVFGVFPADISRMLRTVKVKESETGRPTDKDVILQFFYQNGGEESYSRADDRLARMVAGPLLRQAAALNIPDEIIAVCKTPGLSLNSEALKGGLGQSALHIAVATGSTAALTALLTMRADPNTEDVMRERPLHYAASAGQADAARMLVAAGADPCTESWFAEQPLQVALQNTAGFLKISPEEVTAVLRAALVPTDIQK